MTLAKYIWVGFSTLWIFVCKLNIDESIIVSTTSLTDGFDYLLDFWSSLTETSGDDSPDEPASNIISGIGLRLLK